MKYLLTTILFFISFISFSQDINFGEGEFEVKTTIAVSYTTSDAADETSTV